MYRNSKENATAFLQRILSVAGDFPVTISGEFDNNTRNAVVKFKEVHGLSNDCSVDRTTFDKIYKEFEKKSKRNSGGIIESFPPENEYSIGMMIINKMLFEVLSYLGFHTDIRILPYYYEETEVAIGQLCEVCGLDKEITDDKQIIERLIFEYNSVNRLREIFEYND